MIKTLLSFAFMAISYLSFAQSSSYWNSKPNADKSQILESKMQLQSPKLYSLDIESLKNKLKEVPQKIGKNGKSEIIISFPNSNGILENFKVQENSNFEPSLAAQYPEIKSYSGQNINNSSKIYFSVSPLGLSTMELNNDKSVNIIEPYTKDLSTYAVYNRADKRASLNKFECGVIDSAGKHLEPTPAKSADDNLLRTYRLALSCTAEYSNYFGATSNAQIGLVLAAMNNTMSRVNGVFETDFDIHMNLIGNESAIIFYDAVTDPYDDASIGVKGSWNLQLQRTLTANIGNAGYDIGHLFGASGGGGNAGCIGCVCINPANSNSKQKGSGFTSPADAIPKGDNFDIDYVVHEMGHQFGGNHTFTFQTEGSIAQMEPGSGSTIMAYAGITSADVQRHSDAFFHALSIQQITAYMKSQICSVNTATGNITPIVNAGADYTIPTSTPFMLTGTGADANGDTISYIWEEIDIQNNSTALPSDTKTTGVAFRSFTPSNSAVRYFPTMASILNGALNTKSTATPRTPTPIDVEFIPSVSRTLNFRLTVRDNRLNGGSNAFDDMKVTVSAVGGPFKVTTPNNAVTYTGGTSQTVTWNVASTTSSPISTANVDILVSTDGGITWSTLLAATPNDGSQAVTLPNVDTSTARIMVKANGNIFFDVSDTNFTITGATLAVSNSQINQIQIFPNPVKNILNISNLKSETQFTIYSTTGQLVKKGKIESGSVDVTNLSKGVYIIKIKNNETEINRNFIKE